MKLKLTRIQFKAMYSLFQNLFVAVKPKEMEAMLLHSILMGIVKKMYARDFEDRKKYSLTLTDAEAQAFCVFFTKYEMPIELVYERNLILTITNLINQKFAK